MPKIWIDENEYYLFDYNKHGLSGKEVEITEEELAYLDALSKKFTEGQEVLAILRGTTLREDGWGDPPSVWP